jgi:hypothetical protein
MSSSTHDKYFFSWKNETSNRGFMEADGLMPAFGQKNPLLRTGTLNRRLGQSMPQGVLS